MCEGRFLLMRAPSSQLSSTDWPSTVRLSHRDSAARAIVIEISDDGIGGADAAAGSGLRGLVDRVGALDGSLEITSPPGRGTHLRAELPCG